MNHVAKSQARMSAKHDTRLKKTLTLFISGVFFFQSSFYLSVFVTEVFVVKIFETFQSIAFNQTSMNKRLFWQVNSVLN